MFDYVNLHWKLNRNQSIINTLKEGDMLPTTSCKETDWLSLTLEAVEYQGVAIVTDVVPESMLERIRPAMYKARDRQIRDVGRERLEQAREVGQMRIMLDVDAVFPEILELPQILNVIDRTVSDTAILHLQSGFILPPVENLGYAESDAAEMFQFSFHQDFRRHLEGYLGCINMMLNIDEFSAANGATVFVPGTHQKRELPSDEYLRANALPAEAPAGSMIVFDATTWHASGFNASSEDRLAINHMFTRSYMKQMIDYVRALGSDFVVGLPPRTQQLLGWYTRVVTSNDEYFRPREERLYRANQG